MIKIKSLEARLSLFLSLHTIIQKKVIHIQTLNFCFFWCQNSVSFLYLFLLFKVYIVYIGLVFLFNITSYKKIYQVKGADIPSKRCRYTK